MMKEEGKKGIRSNVDVSCRESKETEGTKNRRQKNKRIKKSKGRKPYTQANGMTFLVPVGKVVIPVRAHCLALHIR